VFSILFLFALAIPVNCRVSPGFVFDCLTYGSHLIGHPPRQRQPKWRNIIDGIRYFPSHNHVSLTYWPEEVVCRASSPLEFVFWPRIGNEGMDLRRMAHYVTGNCSICDAAEKRRKANNLLSSGLRLKGELNTFDKLSPAFWPWFTTGFRNLREPVYTDKMKQDCYQRVIARRRIKQSIYKMGRVNIFENTNKYYLNLLFSENLDWVNIF